MNDERKPNGNRNIPRAPSNAPQKKPTAQRPNVQQRPPRQQNRPVRSERNIANNPAPRHSVASSQKPSNGAQPRDAKKERKSISLPFFKKKIAEPQNVRRRNDESYVFSRSLSETRERILTERRERLEDAQKFQKEDVSQKLRFGVIAFVASVLVVSVIAAIIVSSAISSPKVKKGRGEYIYNIGKKSSEVAYADSIRDDMIYISMNSVAELCELTMTGSTVSGLRFTAKSGDWISFSPDSSEAKINGYGMKMPGPAYVKDTSCSVPLEFLEYVLDGIDVSVDLKEKQITVRRIEYTDSTPLEPHYVDVGFSLKADSILTPLDENKYFAGQPLFTFKNDLTAYEKYMNPSNVDNYLVLINKQNAVGSDYVPSEKLVYIDEKRGLVETAAKALEAMLMEMYSEGFTDIYVISAYRPYSYQVALYYTYVDNEMAKDPSLTQEEAEAIVQTYSAVPGESEHHSGLCVDFISSTMSDLDETFADNEAYDWLLANAWKFGFILRYPKDKVDITEYSFEPWHWRFVGRDAALEMLRTGECFEEYLTRISTPEE